MVNNRNQGLTKVNVHTNTFWIFSLSISHVLIDSHCPAGRPISSAIIIFLVTCTSFTSVLLFTTLLFCPSLQNLSGNTFLQVSELNLCSSSGWNISRWDLISSSLFVSSAARAEIQFRDLEES